MARPAVWIVVPTYNHLPATRRALHSFAAMRGAADGIIVVDNGSQDGTVSSVQREFPDVELVANATNVGFAAAANIGLRQALRKGADWVLVANNDVVADGEMLDRLLAASRGDVAAMGPMIYYLHEGERIWSSGFVRGRWLPEPRRGRRGELDDHRQQEPMVVDYLLGCAMLIRRLALEHVGGFDERYFFYYEDLDFCARLARAGYRCLTVPQARLWHAVATSAGRDSVFRAFHMARGSVIFLATQAHGHRRAWAAAYRALVSVRKTAGWLARGRPDLARVHVAGLADGLRAARQAPRIASFGPDAEGTTLARWPTLW